MATLGAKPNHAFFHCQHPAQKKISARASAQPRARRRSPRVSRLHASARRARTSTCAKQNIFFPVLFFARCVAHPGSTTATRGCDDAHPERIPTGERNAFGVAPSGRFFALRQADCAKVRELFDAFRDCEASNRMLRCGIGDVDRDVFGHARGACDTVVDGMLNPDPRRDDDRRREATRGGATRIDRRDRDARARKKAARGRRGRLRGIRKRAPNAVGARQRRVSGRLLPAARRSRLARAGR